MNMNVGHSYIVFFFRYSGEPSPPSVQGQRGVGKAYRLGLVKQDDGGMPILEYIVKYKTVSELLLKSQ